MTTDEILTDLRERLTKAQYSLIELAVSYSAPQLSDARIAARAKAKGVALALDYLRAYENHTAVTCDPESPETSHSAPGSDETGSEGTRTPETAETSKQGVVRTLPPPERGTHESDTKHGWMPPGEYLVDHRGNLAHLKSGRGGRAEYETARAWSRGEA